MMTQILALEFHAFILDLRLLIGGGSPLASTPRGFARQIIYSEGENTSSHSTLKSEQKQLRGIAETDEHPSAKFAMIRSG